MTNSKFNMAAKLVATVGAAIFAAASSAAAAEITFSNPGEILIPATGTSGDANPFPSEIEVSGITNVTDVDVVLNGLSHTWSGDLEIFLVGPTGDTVVLMADVGGSANWTNDTVRFSDGAPTSFAPGSDGTYGPTGSCENSGCVGAGYLLSVFNGLDLNGVWSLYVYDDVVGDVGRIAEGWSLIFSADAISEVPVPAALLLFMTGAAGLGFGAKRRKSA